MPKTNNNNNNNNKTKTSPDQDHLEAQRKINDLMKKLIPETDSKYALLPIAQGRWLSPNERTETGDLCFIPASRPDKMIRQDYIWVPAAGGEKKGGAAAAGYYHFRTKEAHIETKNRLKKFKPHNSLFSSSSNKKDDSIIQTKKERERYNQIKIFLENRIMSETANDVEAANARMEQMHNEEMKYTGWSSLATFFM